MTYSIIQVATNNYDKVFDCGDKESLRNVLFTDTQTNVKNWEIKKIKSNKEFPFDDIFGIRWNPFNFTDTDYVVWIDASIRINSSIKKYIEQMINGKYDFAVLTHFKRNDVFSEYCEWCNARNYKKETAFMWLNHFAENGLDVKHSGLYQPGIMIFKNNLIMKNFCNDMVKELHYLDKDHYERLDQTIMTMLLKTKYKNIKLLELPYTTYMTKELRLHGSHPAK